MPAVGADIRWTFGDDFNPVTGITALEAEREVGWRCTAGHAPSQDNAFRLQIHPLDEARTRLRVWQIYAVELEDGYYVRALQLHLGLLPRESAAAVHDRGRQADRGARLALAADVGKAAGGSG